ncbi:MAG: hypothetical protein K2N80_08810 [Lachnospiraceae bacterium]|nr:hypothetical protein [Lachnospiraceae bacterium]
MKKCPKNCGFFEDYETKCPVCGARLLKVKAAGQSRTDLQNAKHHQNTFSSFHPTYTQPTDCSQNKNAWQENRGYDFGAGNSKNIGQKHFSYDVHIYGGQQSASDMTASYSASQQHGNVQGSPQNMVSGTNSYAGKTTFRGKVKNLREDVSHMGIGENIFYSMMHGTHMTHSNKTFNFQLLELDQNDNPTGVVYSITFRGEIKVGHFYEGNIVMVKGKQAKSGEIYAKDIYNVTANCSVKMKKNIF